MEPVGYEAGLDLTFAALADPTRRAILRRLAQGEAAVVELTAPFAISQPAISKHLRVLERAGLITGAQAAQRRPRRLAAAPLAEASRWLEQYPGVLGAVVRPPRRAARRAQGERRRAGPHGVPSQGEAGAAGPRRAHERSQAMSGRPQGRHDLHVRTQGECEVVMTRVFDAPADLLFEAYTKTEHLQRWMLGAEGWTMPVCEADVRPGGSYRFVWERPNRSRIEVTGDYREVVPPSRLVMTESWGADWPVIVNTLTFAEADGRTTLTNTMCFPSPAARDAAIKTGMEHGSRHCFEQLDGYLVEMARR